MKYVQMSQKYMCFLSSLKYKRQQSGSMNGTKSEACFMQQAQVSKLNSGISVSVNRAGVSWGLWGLAMSCILTYVVFYYHLYLSFWNRLHIARFVWVTLFFLVYNAYMCNCIIRTYNGTFSKLIICFDFPSAMISDELNIPL